MAAPARRRRPAHLETVQKPPEPAPAPESKPPAERTADSVPFLLDFFPLEESKYTRLARFYEELRRGRLMTTRCPKDHAVHWPPRTVCPKCHATELEWIELPGTGRIYAFSAVLAGAPLGMEADVPFVLGLVDLDGGPLRIAGRIVGAPWTECRVGQPVKVEPFERGDGRVFYRFRVTG